MSLVAEFDVVVVGGGHAGIEATHAAWKLGVKTAMLTMDINAIGRMSCNPAVGGVAKGQIVRDIDALGGLMGLLTDKAGIQFRMLNMSKGPAVWGPRAQCDMKYYSEVAREVITNLPGLSVIQGELAAFTRMADGRLELTLLSGERYITRSLVITSGTFLASKMFTGLETSIGGRVGEPSADKLSECLAREGIALRRLKTGTPSRLDPDSIDFNECDVQRGDDTPWPMSDRHLAETVPGRDANYFWGDPANKFIRNDCVCWITRTNLKTHDILRSGFKDSPMFSGRIHGKGPRYCPSIEDKINRFGDRDGHQLFLEPEQADIGRVYINGFSSSLPADIQLAAIHTIPGLTRARVLQIGYAVEYDSVDATQLFPTFECKKVPGLYFAGQVCGTSGYEEAAGQGLLAGINAALKIKGEEPLILGRSDSYLGVMADDLVNILLDEPYRMFTSRAEYRLFLRSDNADSPEGTRSQDWHDFGQRLLRLEAPSRTDGDGPHPHDRRIGNARPGKSDSGSWWTGSFDRAHPLDQRVAPSGNRPRAAFQGGCARPESDPPRPVVHVRRRNLRRILRPAGPRNRRPEEDGVRAPARRLRLHAGDRRQYRKPPAPKRP